MTIIYDEDIDTATSREPATTATLRRPKRRKRAKRAPVIYTPMGFDASAYGLDPKHDLSARWILNCIYFHRVVGRYEPDQYVPLHSRLLAHVVGDKGLIKPLRERLVASGLIEVDGHWKVGEKSYGYRLGPALKGVKFCKWSGDGTAGYFRRFEKFRAEIASEEGLDELGLHLLRWMKRTQIDRRGLDETLDGMTPEKRFVAEGQITWWEQGVFRAKYCEFGRFHTNASRLCREIRRHLTVGGERLCEIDVVGSQCLFLAELLLPNPPPLPNSLPYDPELIDGFAISALMGTTYEEFQRHHGFASRDEAKNEFFHCVYGSSRNTKLFAALYPVAGRVLRRLKREHGYKWVPQEMQRREARIVLGGAAERLRRESPHVPLLTIHDSFMTTPTHLVLVERVLREAFADCPYRPRLRIDGAVR